METIIISSEFYFKAPYCELTSDAKLLYAHLYTQALTGQEYISCTQKDAAKLLHCTEGTAGKALRSLQDIGLIERFVARRKETLISVYGTDGKPIQPQGDILPSTLAATNSKANIEVDSASSHSENFTEVSNATKNCLSLQQPQADFMQAFIQTFMETFSKLYSSTTSNPKIQKETPVKQQDSDITKIDEYPVLDGNLIIGNDGHILPLEDYKMLVDIYGAKVIKYQIEKIRKKYPPTYMNLKIISRWANDYNAYRRRHSKKHTKRSNTDNAIADTTVHTLNDSDCSTKETASSGTEETEQPAITGIEYKLQDCIDESNKFNNFYQRQYNMGYMESLLLTANR